MQELSKLKEFFSPICFQEEKWDQLQTGLSHIKLNAVWCTILKEL